MKKRVITGMMTASVIVSLAGFVAGTDGSYAGIPELSVIDRTGQSL